MSFIIKKSFITDGSYNIYILFTCQDLVVSLSFSLDYIYATLIYKQVIDLPIGTSCAPLVAGLFKYCYKEITSFLLIEHQDVIITDFNNTSKYLDDFLKYR